VKRLLLALILVSGCTPHISNHIKYFGYARAGDDAASIAATASFTNVATVEAMTCDSGCPAQFAAARAGKVKMIVELRQIFYDPQGDLWPNYQARWAHVQTYVTPNLDITLGFFMNEPTQHGVSAANLATACNLVKATYPSTLLGVDEAYPHVGDVVIPASVDLVGFDRYGVRDPNTDASYVAQYNTIAARRSTPTQKMFVVMDAWWVQQIHGAAGLSLSDMVAVANNYAVFANARPEVLSLVAFVWPPLSDIPQATTSVSRPDWVAEHSKIGKGITGK